MRHTAAMLLLAASTAIAADDFPKPYSAPCVERENVFEFAEKPAVKSLGNDKYEITFAVKGNCDVTVGIVDEKGVVVRHLGSGVLGPNAPAPFQPSRGGSASGGKQKILWNGKDDLDAYHKTPEKLKVRVMLGLKPVFDRLLGGADPRNLPGAVFSFAVDADGVYVFSRGRNIYLRKFDHDGKYLATLAPPPPGLPESKLGGRTYIEYEAGKKSHFGAYIEQDMGFNGNMFPYADTLDSLQSAVVNKRVLYCSQGASYHVKQPSHLYWVHTDGSTDLPGSAGRTLIPWAANHPKPCFAVSPDQKWIYMIGLGGQNSTAPIVVRLAAEGDTPAEPFIGKKEGDGKRMNFAVGSDNERFNNPTSLDTDAAGRIYVADHFNNRVQIFSPEGKHLKTLPAGRPATVQVHKKSGAIYVLHAGEVRGRSVGRITKFVSFDDVKEEFHTDFIHASTFVLDSWAKQPRLWLNGEIKDLGNAYNPPAPNDVTILEERNGKLEKFLNFDEEAAKEAGDNHMGRWSGGVFDHVDCDPVREQLYYQGFRSNPWVFDLKTGKKLLRARMRNSVNDIAFDKRGYLHLHLDPGFGIPGVARLDPDQSAPYRDHLNRLHPGLMDFQEVPYDYGTELTKPQTPGWIGGLPVKDQPGAKYFQDGFGANMRGEIAEQCNIYYIPKMSEESFEAAFAGPKVRVARGGTWFTDRDPYQEFLRGLQERLKHGEEIYSIPRRPGLPLAGGTIWTFTTAGEVQEESAVIAHKLVIGSRIDEDGFLYFSNSRAKLIDGKPFLFHKGGNFGTDKPIYPHNVTPVTYTYMKTRGKDVRWLLPNAVVPLDPKPTEPPQLVPFGPFGETYGDQACWTTGVEWMYAGVSPAVPDGCTCPATRPHLDWYKRSYVTEAYRRSLGILDANGNLIMHVGRYGNLDDTLKMKKGTTDIAMNLPRLIGGTDNYLGFDDWGESLKVLKLEYQAEETVGIQ